jgi:dephospho-CoA kinase
MIPAKTPLQIGVTGGIGSGKSVVCKIFSCLGIPVYNADSRAKWLIMHDASVRSAIVNLLGAESYDNQGAYDRAFVASRVFKDPELLGQLNAIVHPAVQADTKRWVSLNSTYPYVVKEAAIMNRAGDQNSLDFVVVVNAPAPLRIQRVLSRDRRSEDEIKSIIARQISDEERNGIADFRIVNDEYSALIPQVLALHSRFSRGSVEVG